MGKGQPTRPAWTKDIGTMIAHGIRCRARCTICNKYKDVDLVALAKHKGADYDLWNKRTRCRMTPECDGHSVFLCDGRGGFWNMRDPM